MYPSARPTRRSGVGRGVPHRTALRADPPRRSGRQPIPGSGARPHGRRRPRSASQVKRSGLAMRRCRSTCRSDSGADRPSKVSCSSITRTVSMKCGSSGSASPNGVASQSRLASTASELGRLDEAAEPRRCPPARPAGRCPRGPRDPPFRASAPRRAGRRTHRPASRRGERFRAPPRRRSSWSAQVR